MEGFCKWPLQLSQRSVRLMITQPTFCNSAPNKKTVSLPFIYSFSKFPFSAVQNGSEPEDFALWEEPYKQARKWKPCAAKHSLTDEGNKHTFNSYYYSARPNIQT